MAGLDMRLLTEKLDVGPVSAIHLIKGFIDGAELRADKPYIGPMFAKLVHTLALGLPDHDDQGGHEATVEFSVHKVWRLRLALAPLSRLVDELTDFDGGTGLIHALDTTQSPPLRVADIRELVEAARAAVLIDDKSQARPPNPGPEAKPAEQHAPPVDAELSAGERSYREYRASISAEFDGTREALAKARDMFEQWIGDALPANDAGQVHFARALAESMSDAIKAFLTKDANSAPPVDGGLVKHMVDRFLSWKLPENFNPDGGISFKPGYENTVYGVTSYVRNEPTGTNLLDAAQATAMVQHMLGGLPATAPVSARVIDDLTAAVEGAEARSKANWSAVSEIRAALQPLTAWTEYHRSDSDDLILWNRYDGPGTYAEVLLGNVRGILRAAGIFVPIDHRSDDDTAATTAQAADADAPVRDGASVGDASPASAPLTDDQMRDVTTSPVTPSAEPEAAAPPPPPAEGVVAADSLMSRLVGQTLAEVTVIHSGDVPDKQDAIVFRCETGSSLKMTHAQDCCETVVIEEISGELSDIVGSPILVAEERTSDKSDNDYGTDTWTFYTLRTVKGTVDIRWHGSSNGYYSERVDLIWSELAPSPDDINF